MSLSRLVNGKFNSALARRALSTVYKPGRSYSIPLGPLRGLRLHYDRSVNFHAILGLWDSEIMRILDRLLVAERLLPADATVADVGANIGYYAMWFASRAVPRGRVFAFEPNPAVRSILATNIATNAIGNVDIQTAACADHVGTVDFYIGFHHHSSSLDAAWAAGEDKHGGNLTVPATTLDAFFEPGSGRAAPAFVKMDIEGGGVFALPGCTRLFSQARPVVLIESHNPAEDRAISNVLVGSDYAAYRIDDRKWISKPADTHPDPAGVWGTMLLVPSEMRQRVATVLGG